jgi:hypothetical protein
MMRLGSPTHPLRRSSSYSSFIFLTLHGSPLMVFLVFLVFFFFKSDSGVLLLYILRHVNHMRPFSLDLTKNPNKMGLSARLDSLEV